MTIKSIQPTNRYMGFSICDKEGYEKLKSSYSGALFGYTIRYYGYGYNDLTGKKSTSDGTSSDGFNPGKEYFVEFLPNKQVHYYNKEETVDLKGSFVGKQGPFYLFLDFNYYPSSCTLERLL